MAAGLRTHWPHIKVRLKGHLGALGPIRYLGRGSGFGSRSRPTDLPRAAFEQKETPGSKGGYPHEVDQFPGQLGVRAEGAPRGVGVGGWRRRSIARTGGMSM